MMTMMPLFAKVVWHVFVASLASSSSSSSTTRSCASFQVVLDSSSRTVPLPRAEAAALLETQVFPLDDFGRRIRLGKQDQGLGGSASSSTTRATTALDCQDPALSQTYGEFPLASLDTLLDRAVQQQRQGSSKTCNVLDLGSGCGRLALYLALTRPTGWTIHGIELGDCLHQEALRGMEVAVQAGLLKEDEEEATKVNPREKPEGSEESPTPLTSRLVLHHARAEDCPDVLGQADLIFCYSTALASGGFCQTTSALLLSRTWNELLAAHCKPGCLVVTTDKALDPQYRWKLLDRCDVPNPEVWQSTGFLQERDVSQSVLQGEE